MNCQSTTTHKEVIPQITVDKLDMIIAEGSFKIIDVRGPEDIMIQGGIPSSTNIPFDMIDKAIDRSHDQVDHVFSSNRPLLFCCTGGVMSYMAAIRVQENGIKNVYNLEGGHSAWAKFKKAQVIDTNT